MIAIIDYGMGNVASVQNALTKINVESIITMDRDTILNASGIILPGVGSFKKAMQNLKNKNLIEVLNEAVFFNKIKFLGICLGMQLLASHGEEDGGAEGLNWIEGEVKKFDLKNARIPHIGWSEVQFKENLFEQNFYYFIHSYHYQVKNNADILATTNYENEFVSAVKKDNILGVQFHPEKSQTFGLQLLKSYFSDVTT